MGDFKSTITFFVGFLFVGLPAGTI